MDKNALEKFERNIGKPYKVTIGDDEFEFLCLPFKNLMQFFQFTEQLEEHQNEMKKNPDVIQKLPLEQIESVMQLEQIMVKESYPELSEKQVEQFVIKNMYALMTPLMVLNTPSADSLDEKTKANLEDFKKRLAKQNESKQ
jgi:hypothetical protein